MVYERVQKSRSPSNTTASRFVPAKTIQKKPVPEVVDSGQLTMPCYTPLPTDWDASQHFLLRNGANANSDVVQAKMSHDGSMTTKPETATLSAEPPNRTGMPEPLKAGLEQRSGMDLSDVRVHRHSSKPRALQAQAYTQGANIYLGPGQERHLPHEGWHVVQQKEGRVRPLRQMAGASINDDVRLEKEADVMGAKSTTQNVNKASQSQTIQKQQFKQSRFPLVVQKQNGPGDSQEENKIDSAIKAVNEQLDKLPKFFSQGMGLFRNIKSDNSTAEQPQAEASAELEPELPDYQTESLNRLEPEQLDEKIRGSSDEMLNNMFKAYSAQDDERSIGLLQHITDERIRREYGKSSDYNQQARETDKEIEALEIDIKRQKETLRKAKANPLAKIKKLTKSSKKTDEPPSKEAMAEAQLENMQRDLAEKKRIMSKLREPGAGKLIGQRSMLAYRLEEGEYTKYSDKVIEEQIFILSKLMVAAYESADPLILEGHKILEKEQQFRELRKLGPNRQAQLDEAIRKHTDLIKSMETQIAGLGGVGASRWQKFKAGSMTDEKAKLIKKMRAYKGQAELEIERCNEKLELLKDELVTTRLADFDEKEDDKNKRMQRVLETRDRLITNKENRQALA